MSAFIPFRPRPASILWHYANGRLPMWTDGPGSPVGWVSYSHRGVQMLDKIHLGRKQKQDICKKDFEFRIDTAFGEVICACADNRAEPTWITPEIITAYEALHALGHAHSFEIWREGALVGGVYAVQLNGYVSFESMFRRATNAGKAAFVRGLFHLRDRGFTFVDTNGVPPHVLKFGGEWVPQWRFMELLKESINRPLSIQENSAPRPLPMSIRLALPMAALKRKLRKAAKATVLRPASMPLANAESQNTGN